MSSFYTRHELLRHESVRNHSMLKLNHCKKFEYSKYGFYACFESRRFVCFSCNFCIPVSFVGNIHEKHRSYSPSCDFLQGRDVSISDPINHPDITEVRILGSPQFQNKNFFYRKTSESLEKLISPSLLPLGGYYLNSIDWRRKRQYKAFCSPIFIPGIEDSSKFLHIELFFLLMRNEERRLKTFQHKLFPFPCSDKWSEALAKEGFIYTLLNTIVQCAFCRIVISTVTHDIKGIHKLVSPNCKFVNGEECFNIPKRSETIVDSTTEVVEIQCKICLSNCVNIFFDCGHAASCFQCSKQLKNCPICRRLIINKKQIFLS